MSSLDETLHQLRDANRKVDEQESRGKAIIGAKDEMIMQLNTLIEELKARPEVPDDVTTELAALVSNIEDNFATAQEPPTEPEQPEG